MKSIAFDISKSTSNIEKYWQALKMAGLKKHSIEGHPFLAQQKNVLWPYLFYNFDANLTSETAVKNFLELSNTDQNVISLPDSDQFMSQFTLDQPKNFKYCKSTDTDEILHSKVNQAIELIRVYWPDAYHELKAAILMIVWIDSNADKVESLSDPKKFGIIHLNAKYYTMCSVEELANTLVHELAHHSLFVETSIDRLVKNDDYKIPVFSTLRKEFRPAIGALHALFSVARMLLWGERLQVDLNVKPDIAIELIRIQTNYRDGFQKMCTDMLALELTEVGRMMVNEIMQYEKNLDDLTKSKIK